MKQLFLSFWLVLAGLGGALAQRGAATAQAVPGGGGGSPTPPQFAPPVTAFADSLNAVFQHLDKSRVPSGMLEEYGLSLIDHEPYTGTNGFADANQLDINRWRGLYGDLFGARINDNAADMPSLATVNQKLAIYAQAPSIVLPILHFDYHSIRTDALSSGRIRSVRNRLYDVAGQDPYQRNTAFAVAAVVSDLPSAASSFMFRSNLFFTNTGRTVATLQADFADGNGFVGMSWGVARAVSYASGGPKDVRVRVGYTDGSTFESHLLVVSPEPAPAARYGAPGSVAPAVLITADRDYNGERASALVTVEFGGLKKATPDPLEINKPLIVVKGFDLSGFIGGPDARSTYQNFLTKINNRDNQGILSDGADLDGYDLIYVDFNNGTDYIQRNAFLLQKVISWVNDQKARASNPEPNVMLAMSMGGLAAQYALCDIEAMIRAGQPVAPHQVRLLITHDSPHQGANVPLGVQMAIMQLAGTTIRIPFGDDISLVDRLPALGQARAALLSPAAQQLLRYQTRRSTVTFLGLPAAGPVEAAPTSLYDT